MPPNIRIFYFHPKIQFYEIQAYINGANNPGISFRTG